MIKEYFFRHQLYFREAGAEINTRNLNLLKTFSLISAILLLFLLAVTPLLIPDWVVTVQHLVFFPVLLLFYAAAALYQARGTGNRRVITLLCLLFEATFFFFSILIDVFPSATVPSSFTPMLYIAIPVVFTLPFYLTYGLVAFFECLYIILLYSFKVPAIVRHDVFDSIVGIVFSIPISTVILNLRIQDHELRSKYMLLSIQDTLSGILNKKACKTAVERYLSAYNPLTTCSLLILDIDDFKTVNDRCGHYTGDELLRSLGDLLAGTFRVSDVVGRFGGDEFMVLVKDSASRSMLTGKCQTVLEQFGQIAQASCSLSVTCSIGGVTVTRSKVDFISLFTQADRALYEAKNAGKNRCVLHDYQSELPATKK